MVCMKNIQFGFFGDRVWTFILGKSLACLLLITLTAQADAREGESLRAKREDGSVIHYYLFKGQAQSKVLLLILQGSSCNSVLKIDPIFDEYRSISPSADLLLIEKYGIDQTLQYDANDERSDCPDGYIRHDSPKQRVADVHQVLNAVSEQHQYERIVIVGGSEGAVIPHLVA